MVQSLLYWADIYHKLKFNSLCLDIEVAYSNGPISVIGLYQPKEGPVDYKCFINGKDLNRENLIQAFKDCKMLITYNGVRFDVPRIKQEFPGVIPDNLPIIDLYLFAKRLELDTNLKVIEKTLRIERMHSYTEKRHIAVKLWKKYTTYNDVNALNKLLEYNKQDTINLYPLAEQLTALVYKKLGKV